MYIIYIIYIYTYIYIYIYYIYIYIERERERGIHLVHCIAHAQLQRVCTLTRAGTAFAGRVTQKSTRTCRVTADLRTKILDFRGFDSNMILSLSGFILMSTGDFPESLSLRILAGLILVGRLGVSRSRRQHQGSARRRSSAGAEG